ncbi:MAG: acyl-CoA thioesterase [Parvularculaceae bacterium]
MAETTSSEAASWPVVDPFIVERDVVPDDIDEFGHVNNLRYAAWAVDAAWAHTHALGLSFEDYQRIGVGFVIVRHQFDYLSALGLGDAATIATWIAETDSRVRLERRYLMRARGDGRVVFSGVTRFVSVDMKTGRPARMPPEFVDAYAIAVKSPDAP